jgi:hypothetical protein
MGIHSVDFICPVNWDTWFQSTDYSRLVPKFKRLRSFGYRQFRDVDLCTVFVSQSVTSVLCVIIILLLFCLVFFGDLAAEFSSRSDSVDPTFLISSWMPLVFPGNLRRNFLRYLLAEAQPYVFGMNSKHPSFYHHLFYPCLLLLHYFKVSVSWRTYGLILDRLLYHYI